MSWRIDKPSKIKLYTRRQVQASRPEMFPWGKCDECGKKFPQLKRTRYGNKMLCSADYDIWFAGTKEGGYSDGSDDYLDEED